MAKECMPASSWRNIQAVPPHNPTHHHHHHHRSRPSRRPFWMGSPTLWVGCKPEGLKNILRVFCALMRYYMALEQISGCTVESHAKKTTSTFRGQQQRSFSKFQPCHLSISHTLITNDISVKPCQTSVLSSNFASRAWAAKKETDINIH